MLGRRDLPVPPPPCHPQSCPSQLEDLEMRVAEDSAVSAKTPNPPNGKDLSSGHRGETPPPGPSRTLHSTQPQLSPRSPGSILPALSESAGPVAPPRGGAPRRPKRDTPGWPLSGQDPGERRVFSPGQPPLPASPERKFPGGTGAAGLGSPGRGPYLQDVPSLHPPAPTERPPLTQRRGDTDCAGKAALLRRAAAEAAGGAGGGRGAGLRGRRPAAFARSPSPGGVSVPRFSLQPWECRERRARLRPRPCPGEGSGRSQVPGPLHEGAPRGERRIQVPVSSASRLRPEQGGGSPPRDLFPKPGTTPLPAGLPHPYLGWEPHVAPRAEFGS